MAKPTFYGFEDYHILSIYSRCLKYAGFAPRTFMDTNATFIIPQNIDAEITCTKQYGWYDDVRIVPGIVNHKELLSSAKKIYVHPDCNLSRTMMAEKYKKSLNPWLSDAVVIPDYNNDDIRIADFAVFINDSAKIIVLTNISNYDEEDDSDILNKLQEGVKFRDVASLMDNYCTYNLGDVLESELIYKGKILSTSGQHRYVYDILTYAIPGDKTVFEKSVQKSLGSESNKIDFESMLSIRDMINSSDENTVSTGLKALSMMDWMHYPCSIRYILRGVDCYKWKWNKACNSTSVKYMMSQLSNNRPRNSWPGSDDNSIYKDDFELFKKLKCHYDNITENEIMSCIRYMNFMVVDSTGCLVPRIKQESSI